MNPRCLVLLAVLWPAPPARPAAPPRGNTVSFRAEVYPLLKARCLRCHQGANPRAGLRLDSRAELLGETNGKALAVPGAGDRSRLVRAVAGLVPDKVMPPPGRGKRLSAAEVRLLRAWVDQGLAWDDKLLPPPPAPEHWAFKPITRPPVPKVHDPRRARNPVDAFVAARQRAAGLTPAPEAPRPVLVRRLYLDLLGLPPTPEEVDAFVRDRRPDAYERLVDRLLASPHYGERWARHWLDLARWAESEGYESNHPQPYAWRYRDYVVASFNSDRPFAEFVRQQIAGDEIVPYSDENLIATGFLASARLSSNEEDKFRQRNDVLVDVVNATGGTFLGLTVHCAQCHNHKFDPITARDYYRLQAFFVRGQPGNLALKDRALVAKYESARPPEYEPAHKLKESLDEVARARLTARVRRTLDAQTLEALDTPPGKRTPEQERLARQADLKFQFSPTQLQRALGPEDRKLYAELKKKLLVLQRRTPDRPHTWGFYSPATSPTKVDVLPMKGFYPLPFAPRELAGARARLLAGGDVHRPGPAVEPGWPAVLGRTPRGLVEKTPRLALADWLASPRNPLTARVWVNRLWQYHFGRGIVATPSDFGVKGDKPTHPELLDWLASEFLRNGGHTKPIHRLIVSSRTYRQSSQVDPANARLDPDNTLLWHFAPRRLEAEVIRDSMLAVSGELDPTPGGRGDDDEVWSRRRALYLFQKREAPPGVQALFDGPNAAAESCPRRGVSTVALQALYLLNNEFALARARGFARRVLARAGDDPERQCAEAFALALGRPPDEVERRAARTFFAAHGGERPAGLVSFCQALLNVNEFVYLE